MFNHNKKDDWSDFDKKFKNFDRNFTIMKWGIIGFNTLIVGAVIFGLSFAFKEYSKARAEGRLSYGVNGNIETRCIGGFQHTVNSFGITKQVIGEKGGGVPCQ